MQQIILGRTGLSVSRIAFGAGPVSGLMTGHDRQLQLATVRQAIASGVNWIDTAAGYGLGASETNLGEVLAELTDCGAEQLHIATKVRIDLDSAVDYRSQVQQSVQASLTRLKRSRVTLLQLHNGLTKQRGAQPATLSPEDVLRPGGVLDALHHVQNQGLTGFIGLTGTGEPEAMRQVVNSGQFDTIQLPYNMLNPSAGEECQLTNTANSDESDRDRNYGNILKDCAQHGMGAFAIRVLAAGAVLGSPPSAHTLKTPFFPLSLYQRDAERAMELWGAELTDTRSVARRAVDFALAHKAIHAAIIGFGRPEHILNLD